MQDPLKNNKAFKESYLSYQAHKKYLTPYNVDSLVYSLHQIKEQETSSISDRQQNCGFVDTYIQTTLPTVIHKPLVAEVKPWMTRHTDTIPSSHSHSGVIRHSVSEPNNSQKSSWEKPLLRDTTRYNRTLKTAAGKQPLWGSFRQRAAPVQRPRDHLIQREQSSLEIPILESSIKTKPDSMLTMRCSLPVNDEMANSSDEKESETDDSNEVDSGWHDQDDEEEGLLSDIEEDEPYCSSHETWEYESTEGESDSGHFQSGSLSPLHDTVVHADILPSMIPPRLTYPGEHDDGISLPLTPSVFHNLPPTIHFPLPNENYKPLSSRQKSLLKWKLSTITPNVIKRILDKVGFTYTSKGTEWIGYWGKHMKPEVFRSLLPHQKVNHLPGSFQIGRKDRLWRNLSRMQAHFGRKEFDFIPQTFVLPSDMRQFKRTWEAKDSHKQKWIIKPPASARGIGIQVVHKWSQIPKRRPIIVQQYLSDPYLINGSKFDLRIYVYVSCIDPLTIYIYRDGLVRFATKKYSQSTKTLSNRFVHLTNYSINKKSVDFKANSDETQCFGHKWGLLALWDHMDKHLGIDPRPVWGKIKDLVIKTILSCEGYIASLVKANCRESSVTHELFGFDIMLDKHLKPWILEVNVSPSLHSNSRLDFNIKGHLMRDLLNMACFNLPPQIFTSKGPLTSMERAKHSYYSRLTPLQEIERRGILREITSHDYKILTRYIDENERRGGFIPVYPTLDTIGTYRQFFQYERYNNILIEEWLKLYNKRPEKGIEYLNSL